MTTFSRRGLAAVLAALGGVWAVLAAGSAAAGHTCVLQGETFRHYVDEFNRGDRELYAQYIPNSAAWDFLKDNIPLLDCPDPEIEQVYYFRWWTFRKHVKQTPAGFVVTEFLPPVGWSGKYNTINCAAGHHLREGRWLADPRVLDDYTRFWFRGGGDVRAYSCWIAAAVWSRFLVTGDDRLMRELLGDLTANFEAWEKGHRDGNGLFWQIDDRDGMEMSIGGSGYRATINSYMFGDALAIARMAERFGQKALAVRYRDKAAEPKRLVEAKLWDRDARFFKVLPRGDGAKPRDVPRAARLHPLVFRSAGGGQERGLAAAFRARRFCGPLRTDDRRAPPPAVRPFLPGPRVPMERAELALRHGGDADGHGQFARQLPAERRRPEGLLQPAKDLHPRPAPAPRRRPHYAVDRRESQSAVGRLDLADPAEDLARRPDLGPR